MYERRQFFGMQHCRRMTALDRAKFFIRCVQLIEIILLRAAVTVLLPLQDINRHFQIGDLAETREICRKSICCFIVIGIEPVSHQIAEYIVRIEEHCCGKTVICIFQNVRQSCDAIIAILLQQLVLLT